jgi:hypothetical protein
MQKRKCFIGIIIIVFFLLAAKPSMVQAIPPLPSSFHGTVKDNNANVADGTVVEALINNQVFARGYTQTYNGESVYILNIPGDDGSTTAVDGGKEGDIVHFKVGGIAVEQTGTWHSGTSAVLNLSVSSTVTLNTPAPTPTPYPTQTAIVIIQSQAPSKTPEMIQTSIPAVPTSGLQTSATLSIPETTGKIITQTPPEAESIPGEESSNSTLLIILLSIIVIVSLILGIRYFRKSK